MKYCKTCGAELLDSDAYCTKCGNPVDVKKPEVIENKSNGMAIAGFICAFFIPLLGWIFGGIGLKKSKVLNGNGRGLAVAAIIIATLNYVLTFYLVLTGKVKLL